MQNEYVSGTMMTTDRFAKWEKHLGPKLHDLTPEEKLDVYIWTDHQREANEAAGDKWEDVMKRGMQLLPIRLMQKRYGPKMRCSEWISFRAARSLETDCPYKQNGKWNKNVIRPVTQRTGVRVSADLINDIKCVLRLDAEHEYWAVVDQELIAEIEGEIVQDLALNNPTMGEIRVREGCGSKELSDVVAYSILDCIEDISHARYDLYGAEPGRAFAIVPHDVAQMLHEHKITEDKQDVAWRMDSITTYWGKVCGGLSIYSHPKAGPRKGNDDPKAGPIKTGDNAKIIVGFRPDDDASCGYFYKPYSFGLFGGPDAKKYPDHYFANCNQIVIRRAKFLARESKLYGVIQYNPKSDQNSKML